MCKCHESAFDCIQGRGCPARSDVSACNAQGASACSELLKDESAERRMSLARYFWAAYLTLLLVAVGAGIAYFLPALKALVNN